jgi:hypothetical protein
MASYPEFRRCYEESDDRRWTMAPDGTVLHAELVRSSFPQDSTIPKCVRDKFYFLAFPIADAVTKASWTFEFRPKSGRR